MGKTCFSKHDENYDKYTGAIIFVNPDLISEK